MWVDREHPKWRAVYDNLPHDDTWRTTAELFALAARTDLVRIGDNMGGLIGSMRNHHLAESKPAAKGMQHRLLEANP